MYDSLDRVDEIRQGTAGNTALTCKFVYNGDGDLYELRNYKTLRATFFEYDHAGRCINRCIGRDFDTVGSWDCIYCKYCNCNNRSSNFLCGCNGFHYGSF